MNFTLTKTDYILWRECKKNVWLKVNRPDIYEVAELTDFEKQIIETGNEVELLARKLFPKGFLVEGRGLEAQQLTQDLLVKKHPITFQANFFYPVRNHARVDAPEGPVGRAVSNGVNAAVDVLELNEDGSYNIYEIKSTTDIDKKTHYHDLAFQAVLLEKSGLDVNKTFLVHLNSEYIRQGELNINQLFTIEDVTETVKPLLWTVGQEMDFALKYLTQADEPKGACDCVYKGRSNHCSTFAYSNPKVPGYGVHDISRIGASKSKLVELVDVGIFELQDVPEDFLAKLSSPQRNQIIAHVEDRILHDKLTIKKELDSLVFPLYFLDYETFPSAIPRFDGFGPYQQIPFQYSVYVLEAPGRDLQHFEFLCTQNIDPSQDFINSLQSHIGESGAIIVWNKGFECKINNELAQRLPNAKPFMEGLNARVYDLMDIFGKQLYVHKGFKGRISIKNILPVLVPELSYKELDIQEGGTASQKWNEMVQGGLGQQQKEKIANDLKKYCGLDTYAMYVIWQYLTQAIN